MWIDGRVSPNHRVQDPGVPDVVANIFRQFISLYHVATTIPASLMEVEGRAVVLSRLG